MQLSFRIIEDLLQSITQLRQDRFEICRTDQPDADQVAQMHAILVPPRRQLHPHQGWQRDQPKLTGIFAFRRKRVCFRCIFSDLFTGKDNVDGVAWFRVWAIEEYVQMPGLS